MNDLPLWFLLVFYVVVALWAVGFFLVARRDRS